MTTTSVGALAELVGGRLIGDPTVQVDRAATLLDVRGGEITLVDGSEKVDRLAASRAGAAVAPVGFPNEALRIPVVVVDDVHRAFAAIVAHFRPLPERRRRGISRAAQISSTARLAADVEVHPGAMIADDVEIGSGSTIHSGACIMSGCRLAAEVTIYPNAVLYGNTIVGPRSTIHAGAVIGCYGFGYSLVEGEHKLSAQLGYVEIGADVDVGASSTIDRGTYGATVIGDGTKIDNLVMIAHNCHIGRHNLICSQVGIAGSTTTGDHVVMAGQVGVRDHVHVGDRAILGAMSGVINDIPAGAYVLGIPATPERQQKLTQAALIKLPEMRRQLKALQRAVDELTHKDSGSDGIAAA